MTEGKGRHRRVIRWWQNASSISKLSSSGGSGGTGQVEHTGPCPDGVLLPTGGRQETTKGMSGVILVAMRSHLRPDRSGSLKRSGASRLEGVLLLGSDCSV